MWYTKENDKTFIKIVFSWLNKKRVLKTQFFGVNNYFDKNLVFAQEMVGDSNKPLINSEVASVLSCLV